jgi:hypothetical protein
LVIYKTYYTVIYFHKSNFENQHVDYPINNMKIKDFSFILLILLIDKSHNRVYLKVISQKYLRFKIFSIKNSYGTKCLRLKISLKEISPMKNI